MFDYADLGGYLRRVRRERKLSMQRVADIIGITVEALGKFERGKSNLKLENIMALCDLYQITVPVFETYYSRSEEMQAMMDILLPDGIP